MHEARTAELKAMTAKSLRPIAKDLGITGASRMTKDALIDEIISAERLADDLANEAALAEATGLDVAEVGVATSERELGPIEESDGRCPYGSIHEIETCFPCGTEDADGNQISARPLFVRHTRRGSETVAVERVHAGRVDYRILDTKTQRVSAPYRMRERTFFDNYAPAPVTS